MRALAMTGIVTASWMPLIIAGSDIRATPPSRRMSAGTRSSAITATAPASSAIFASLGGTTSMITPPFSISAKPVFSRNVARSGISGPVDGAGDRGLPGIGSPRSATLPRRRRQEGGQPLRADRDPVEPGSGHESPALDHQRSRLRHVLERQSVLQDGEEEDPEKRPEDRAATAVEGDPSEDHRGQHFEFEPGSERGGRSTAETRRKHHPGQTGGGPGGDEQKQPHRHDPYARQIGRLRVDAD